MAAAKRKPLIAGNWKMNGLRASAKELRAVIRHVVKEPGYSCDVLICPPATLIAGFSAEAKGSRVWIGGQDCHAKPAGAHTGDVAAEMLRDAGARAVIVGHSERRADHGESDEVVRQKAEAALRAGLMAIICVGETLAQRDKGETMTIVKRQLAGSIPVGAAGANIVIAYEPVWAIGTGRTPSGEEILEVHKTIRNALSERLGQTAHSVRILYGGSVKPDNAALILSLEHVDGALIGGASLKAADLMAIAKTYARSKKPRTKAV